MKYDFAAIEKKWQDKWEISKPYAAVTGSDKPKFYGLIEFPYPSGAGLHVGHPRPFTAIDIVSRKKRMEGYNVLFPIGFDAFGLRHQEPHPSGGRHQAEYRELHPPAQDARLRL